MSVSVFITNNRKWVEENCPELITTEKSDLLEMEYKIYPFEDFNLANANFRAFFSQLGLITGLDDDSMWFGSATADDVLKALDRFEAKHLVTQDREEDKILYSFGRTLEQVTGYYWRLRRLAVEAKRRGQDLAWG